MILEINHQIVLKIGKLVTVMFQKVTSDNKARCGIRIIAPNINVDVDYPSEAERDGNYGQIERQMRSANL